jgi:hypothetical protein
VQSLCASDRDFGDRCRHRDHYEPDLGHARRFPVEARLRWADPEHWPVAVPAAARGAAPPPIRSPSSRLAKPQHNQQDEQQRGEHPGQEGQLDHRCSPCPCYPVKERIHGCGRGTPVGPDQAVPVSMKMACRLAPCIVRPHERFVRFIDALRGRLGLLSHRRRSRRVVGVPKPYQLCGRPTGEDVSLGPRIQDDRRTALWGCCP